MRVGTAQIEITPQPGIELSGFQVRPQPSTEVLDPLWMRALYLDDGAEKCLWLHTDLGALEQRFADQLRRRIAMDSGLPFARILLVATHTHSGPAVAAPPGGDAADRTAVAAEAKSAGRTLKFDGGMVEPVYVTWLEAQIRRGARLALDAPEPCRLVAVEGRCELAVDRCVPACRHPGDRPNPVHTGKPRGHCCASALQYMTIMDPRVGCWAFRRGDGSFSAVLLCYSMHPACLCSSQISADWPGETARVVSEALPGRPVVVVSTGACGDMNPPRVGTTPDEMRQVGRQVAQSVLSSLLARPAGAPHEPEMPLRFRSTEVSLPCAEANVEQVEEHAGRYLAKPAFRHLEPAVRAWRENLLGMFRCGGSPGIGAKLAVLAFGPTVMIAVNAEIFARFNTLVGASRRFSVFTAGCANGMIGYVAPAQAYEEGGYYEVERSAFSYNLPRLRKGGFELLAQQACHLLDALA